MLRKGDVVICDTRKWYSVFKRETRFDPHFMLGIVMAWPKKNIKRGRYEFWVDVGIGKLSGWPFYSEELTKIGRL